MNWNGDKYFSQEDPHKGTKMTENSDRNFLSWSGPLVVRHIQNDSCDKQNNEPYSCHVLSVITKMEMDKSKSRELLDSQT